MKPRCASTMTTMAGLGLAKYCPATVNPAHLRRFYDNCGTSDSTRRDCVNWTLAVEGPFSPNSREGLGWVGVKCGRSERRRKLDRLVGPWREVVVIKSTRVPKPSRMLTVNLPPSPSNRRASAAPGGSSLSVGRWGHAKARGPTGILVLFDVLRDIRLAGFGELRGRQFAVGSIVRATGFSLLPTGGVTQTRGPARILLLLLGTPALGRDSLEGILLAGFGELRVRQLAVAIGIEATPV